MISKCTHSKHIRIYMYGGKDFSVISNKKTSFTLKLTINFYKPIALLRFPSPLAQLKYLNNKLYVSEKPSCSSSFVGTSYLVFSRRKEWKKFFLLWTTVSVYYKWEKIEESIPLYNLPYKCSPFLCI